MTYDDRQPPTPGIHRPHESARVASVMLAQSVIQNALTGNTSFIEIFNEMRFVEFPSALAFHVVTMYSRENMGGFEHRVRVAIHGFTWETTVAIPRQPLPFFFIGAGPIMPLISAEGELIVTIFVDGEEAFERRYPVRKLAIASTEEAAPVEDKS